MIIQGKQVNFTDCGEMGFDYACRAESAGVASAGPDFFVAAVLWRPISHEEWFVSAVRRRSLSRREAIETVGGIPGCWYDFLAQPGSH